MKFMLFFILTTLSLSAFANLKECAIYTEDAAVESILMQNRFRIGTEDSHDIKISFKSKLSRVLGGSKTTVSISVQKVTQEKTLMLYSKSVEDRKWMSFDATSVHAEAAPLKIKLLQKMVDALRDYDCDNNDIL